jgi:MoaA/NifB/PqqE/SkfB family radical SAM enzyme
MALERNGVSRDGDDQRPDVRAYAGPVLPTRIRLEASSQCQLRCPSCPTTTGAIHPAIGAGFLKLTDFTKLLDDNPHLRHIELSNYGEIFLNPELLGIIEYAFRRRVALTANNGTNLNSIKPDVLEGLVKYRFRSLRCSIDGATPETYRRYRVRGNLDRVLGHIRDINRLKHQHQSPHPRLVWQFVVFGHNEHEIPLARQLARELDMEFRLKLSWDDQVSPLRDRDRVRQEVGIGAATRAEFREQHGVDYMHPICRQLWIEPQINWEGTVLGCCRNFWGDFGGNAFRDGLRQAVNSEKMRYAREMLRGRAPARDDIPCTTCAIYVGMRTHGRWLMSPAPETSATSEPR